VYYAYRVQSYFETEMKEFKSSQSQQAFMIIMAPGGLLVLCGLLCFLIRPAVKKVRQDEEEEEDLPAQGERDEETARAPGVRNKAKEPFPFEDEAASEDIETPEPPPAAKRPAPPPVEHRPPVGPPVAVFKCPQCGKTLKKTDPKPGKPIKCPGCATTFPIPAEAVEKALAAVQRHRGEG